MFSDFFKRKKNREQFFFIRLDRSQLHTLRVALEHYIQEGPQDGGESARLFVRLVNIEEVTKIREVRG